MACNMTGVHPSVAQVSELQIVKLEGASGAAKHERLLRGRGTQQAVRSEVAAKRLAEGDAAPAGPALGLDRPDAVIPALLDSEDPSLEVDVGPPQGAQLAASQAGVEGSGPESTIALPQFCDQLLGLGGARDPLAASPAGGSARPSVGLTSTSERARARR